MLFKQYKTSINEDDTVNIHDVEIFKLGNHKGFDFTKEWADKALANFASEKQNDFLPSVIIGHNKPGGEEKPAKGFMDNLRVQEDTVITDITKVPPAMFESMKNREYPHRSVEVNPAKHKFTALALLGGTPPYHKLPVMEFHDDEEHEIIDFEIDLAKAIKTDVKYDQIFRVISKIRDAISSIRWDGDMKETDKTKETKSILKQASTILSNESKNFNEGRNTMDPILKDLTPEQLQAAKNLGIQQFKEEYGASPEELAQQNKKFKDDAQNVKLQAFKDKISAFGEKLKTDLKVAPKFADKLIKFLETQSADAQPVIKFLEDDKEIEKPAVEYFQDLITDIFKEAAKKDGQLFVPDGEMEDVDFEDGLDVGVDDRQRIHEKAVKQANKLVTDGKFENFNDAYNSVIFSIQ